ncbi:MAG: glutamate--tRNA ligase [Rickettsiales bacterium]|nr:glutamate--tRNA ligase [Rickettsiales bacterium]
MTTITRFAPSPTGFLHIGGARTALFNWLYAKHCGGKFLLRVEDTDQARSTQEAKQAILEGMDWLGLNCDDEIVFQSERIARHQEIAQQLLDSGHAYKCYCTPEEVTEMREQARKEGRVIRSPWRERDTSVIPDTQEYAVRIKAPTEGDLVIKDAVQGDVSFAYDQLDDLIILRSDGTPTYMLAVVVDDHDMGVTHIIRGDDHLSNAARQAVIFQALGWELPVFAHIPLIHGADGAKLSKRHGALGVEAYRDMGYLPEAIRNYLLKLGWSHGDDEIISTEQAIEWFDLDGINKAAARFDFDKLNNMNGQYIREAEDAYLLGLCMPMLDAKLGGEASDEQRAIFAKALPSLKERAKLLPEIVEASLFFFQRPNAPQDEKAAKQLDDGKSLMRDFLEELNGFEEWNHEALFPFAKEWAEQRETKIGKLMAPIRVAITGSTASPSMFEVMEILGKDESLARLKAAC